MQGNDTWLTVKRFNTTSECIAALREDGREIWATDLSQQAVSIEDQSITIPNKVALVIGRESDGVSKEMLEASDRRVYLPIHGFSESLNLSVASALILQRMFFICPEAKCNLGEDEKSEIRQEWYTKLAK